MQSWHIHISGRVQGVGFRPFVYRLARSLHLEGTVQNGLDGVHIYLSAEADTVDLLCQQLEKQAPKIAQISNLICQPIEGREFSGFNIVKSDASGHTKLHITPDLGLCDNCRRELQDAENRRYQYPFITCTHCGPRYSILKALPFDRENTSMQDFTMCSECEAEYSDINYKFPSPPLTKAGDIHRFVPPQTGKRYHAQTNSCQDCGIRLSLYELGKSKSPLLPLANGEKELMLASSQIESVMIIQEVSQLLLAGKIIAVKGVGGYLLMADATAAETVTELRRRKQRPAKPFALMYPSLEAARQDVEMSPEEANELRSYRAPILLLKQKEEPKSTAQLQDVAPGLKRLGVMLPYTPLFELIAGAVHRPLIATSANLSGSPIFYRDHEALKNLSGIADYVLSNDREICLPQDDSVMQMSQVHQQPIILRRSRGLAPSYRLPVHSPLVESSCLAMGAQQKSSFALSAHQQLYLSQYLGELSNYTTSEAYCKTLEYFLQLCRASPEVVIADLHPEYFATQLGQQLAKEKNIPVRYVQHHRAHFGAVLAENDLLQSSEPILGVIWDGTGLGDDRQVWGGEFFTFTGQDMQRIAHLAYCPQRFGDKMAREPRLSLLCLTENHPGFEEILQKKFSQQEWKLYQKVLSKPATQHTSSMGRLFDAVAALLGICDINAFESQAAILLEQQAAAFLENNEMALEDGYHFRLDTGSFKAPLSAMLHDLQNGISRGEIAARFHLGMVRMISEMARSQQISRIAFSGGVFQNALLNDLILTHLSEEFTLYFHRQLSPNDESLPLGQIACHWLSQRKARKTATTKNLEPETVNL